MSRKFWKVLGISLALILILLLLFVVAFVFNPFEGSLPDMRELVPRNVDYFARKTELRSDFSTFPEPLFWSDIAGSEHWQSLQRGPTFRDLDQQMGLQRGLQELASLTAQVQEQSKGFIDVLGDFLGDELIVAGRLVPPSFASAKVCVYTRVSTTARFLWGLAQWESVQSNMQAQGLQLVAEGDGSMSLSLPDGSQWFIARHLDCVLLANDRELLDDSLAMAVSASASSDSFGGSADYRDGIEGRLAEWRQRTGVDRPRVLELYARPDQVLPLIPALSGWPDPRHPDDINQRLMASFINFSGWRFLSGSLIFEGAGPTLLMQVDLNRNEHTVFQGEFFTAEPQDRREWLNPFLSMVPAGRRQVNRDMEKSPGACAAAAIRVPAAEFLVEMFSALDAGTRDLLDDALRRTGTYQSTRDLIQKLGVALEPRIGFVFRPKTDLFDGGAPEWDINDPTPAPHFAWVFWIRDNLRQPVDELFEFLGKNYRNLGFEKSFELSVSSAAGDKAKELTNPNITGTGSIALTIFGDFLIVGNAGPLITSMIKARLNEREPSLLDTEEFQREIDRDLASRVNGFGYLNGYWMTRVMNDYLAAGSGNSLPDPSWALSNRPRIEQQVFRQSYRQHGSVQAAQQAEGEAFDKAVDEALGEAWQKERSRFLSDARAGYSQARDLLQMVDYAFFQVELNPQSLKAEARVLLPPR